jgi:hypothetical protein
MRKVRRKQEQTMNAMPNTKLRAPAIGAAAAVALAATLFTGAGTAHAANPVQFTNDNGTLEVIYGGGGLSVFATIVDTTNPPGVTEICHYHSVGVQPPTLPFDADKLVTGPNPSTPLIILVPLLGDQYSVAVTCNGTGNEASYAPVFYG